jgi:hypothetical protein
VAAPATFAPFGAPMPPQQQNYQHQHQHFPLEAAVPKGAQTLSFKNLIAAPLAQPSTLQPPARTSGANAAHVLATIAAAQKRAAPLPLVASRPPVDDRVLPSGFLSGGNVAAGAQAEVLRLSAKLDALQTHLSAQSDRLLKTEASLVRANRTMTSERATANARLLRMQTDLTDLRSKEAKLRDQASTRIFSEPKSSQSNFESLANMSAERDALTKQAREACMRADGSATVAAERGVALQTLQDSHAHLLQSHTALKEKLDSATAHQGVLLERIESSKTESEVTAASLQSRLDELVLRLAETRLERDAATSARTELQEKIDAASNAGDDLAVGAEVEVTTDAHANTDLYDAACASIEALTARVDALVYENQALKETVDDLSTSALSGENELLTEKASVASTAAASLRHELDTLTHQHDELRRELQQQQCLDETVATDAPAANVEDSMDVCNAVGATHTAAEEGSVAMETDACVLAEAPPDMLNLIDTPVEGVSCIVNAPVLTFATPKQRVVCSKARRARIPHKLANVIGATTAFGEGVQKSLPWTAENLLTSTDASGTNGLKTAPHPDVQSLFNAISADVRTSFLQQRQKYLRASGMDDSSVALHMERFSST